MYSNTGFKLIGFLMLLTFAFLFFSASSCERMGVVPNTCAFADYRCIARFDASKYGIPMDNFERQINQESGFNPYAVSWAGAQGIAQIMPSTAQGWDVNPWDADDALDAAAKHMAGYVSIYGSYDKALGCYNAGCSRVDWAIQNCNYWLNCMPNETQGYVNVIMEYR